MQKSNRQSKIELPRNSNTLTLRRTKDSIAVNWNLLIEPTAQALSGYICIYTPQTVRWGFRKSYCTKFQPMAKESGGTGR